MSKKSKSKESEYGSYYTIPFSKSRQVVEDYISIGKKTMKVYAIGDIDVTDPREKMKEYKKQGMDLSFSAYLLYSFVQTVHENPRMQAMKHRRRKMVVFEDVDVNFIVEREVKGVKVPTTIVIRKAQEKSIKELTAVIRGTQKLQNETMVAKDKESGPQTAFLLKLPSFIRKWLFDFIFKNPFRRRKFLGTVGLTSIGMYTGGGGTSIPIAAGNLSINVGGIQVRPGYSMLENGDYDTSQVVPREYLWLTIMVDHTTVDGGPIARFIAKFRKRVRDGFGLDKVKPGKK
jgi:pyruvate/2-oxoglutarate dehydrogenase complex dihydrolipoamide acyltransferase (E2) component